MYANSVPTMMRAGEQDCEGWHSQGNVSGTVRVYKLPLIGNSWNHTNLEGRRVFLADSLTILM